METIKITGYDLEMLKIKINRPPDNEVYVINPDEYHEFEFETGDKLTVIPTDIAATLHRTPDGCVHVPTSDGHSLRVPLNMEIASFRSYKMPLHLVLLTGAGPETLDPIGKIHVERYHKHMGLDADMTVLEIGCGIGRDAFQFFDVIGPNGHYVGTDVTHDSIFWCQKNISAKHPNFEFYHFDIKHELYNPLGAYTSLDFSLPVEDHSVDRVFLGSVFTHLFEDEITHYMKEISRILKPSGIAYATFFLYSDDLIESARNESTDTLLSFAHPYGDGCYVDNAEYPTGAVAFTDKVMNRMIKMGGLKLEKPFLKGRWSGYHEQSDDGQEVAILSPA